MNRRSFITSTLQALALVGAVKLGLGNMTGEDVRIEQRTVWSYSWDNASSCCIATHVSMDNGETWQKVDLC